MASASAQVGNFAFTGLFRELNCRTMHKSHEVLLGRELNDHETSRHVECMEDVRNVSKIFV
jgi:hypothetical protein